MARYNSDVDKTLEGLVQKIGDEVEDLQRAVRVLHIIPTTIVNDYTVLETDDWIINNKPATICTLTLPSAAIFPGFTVKINTRQPFGVQSASANVIPQAGGVPGTIILPVIFAPIIAPIIPNAPTIGVASDIGTARPYNNGSATIAFTPNAIGSIATLFTAVSSPGGFTATSTGSPITITGLQTGIAYTFTVIASNANGSSLASLASNSITTTTVPQSPTIGTATTTGSTTATIAYTPNNTGGLTTTYTVSPGTGSGASPIGITGLAASSTYTFIVTATNANGSATSGVSNSITTAVGTTVPGAPTGVSASATGTNSANVAWTAPASDGGSAISSYTITSSPGGLTWNVSGAGSGSLNISGLNASTTYTFTIYATNTNGNSASSAASNSITTYSPPPPPTVPGPPVFSAAAIGGGQAAVNWSAPYATGGSPIIDYHIMCSPAPRGIIPGFIASSPGSTTYPNLTVGATYTFTAYCTNSIGNSPTASISVVAT